MPKRPRRPAAARNEPAASHVVLPPEYDHALIGHTISATQAPRFVYSINKIVAREVILGKADIETAREAIFELVKQISADHGDLAPVFVDDAISTQEKPLIYLPGGGTNR